MSTVGKLQAKLAELLQINEDMVTHIESLVAERDYFKNGMAELQDVIDKLEPERDALVAQVEACSAALKSLLETPLGIGGSLQSDGQFYYKVPESVFKKVESTLAKTPEQCLREIQAEAGRAGFVAGMNYCINFLDSNYPTLGIEDCANDYVAELQQGGAE